MRILYYNWIQFDNAENKGGGVSLYQRNLIEVMCQNPDNEIFFLSSGREYCTPIADPYIQETDNCFGNSCHSYTVVNSPVLATGNYLNSSDLSVYLKETSLYRLIRDFISEIGGIDVIHFNNFEGLSLSVLRLKEAFPDVQMIYSLHNYFPFCTQVNLWSHGCENCLDYQDGSRCPDCHDIGVSSAKIKEKLALDALYKSQTEQLSLEEYQRRQQAIDDKYSADKHKENGKADVYRCFREETATAFNRYVDCILAVSNRVREIAVSMGIQTDKIRTSYIGTKFADRQLGRLHNISKDVFTIAYLGYMRQDKGFYFFLETCEKMSPKLCASCDVVFAAKASDPDAKERIEALKNRFHGVFFYDGYSHENMEEILASVHLGIVPVLWEDNLPQIAIEMVSMGVPVLSSHLGGAKELTESENFCFRAGDFNDFEEKLMFLKEHPQILQEYFAKGRKLVTMTEHAKSLQKIYEGTKDRH